MGQAAFALSLLLVGAAFLHPLAPGARPWVRLATTLVLGMGVVATAMLASLSGRRFADQGAFYVFLMLAADGVGQAAARHGWPGWPLVALIVAAVGVAEPLPLASAVAAVAAALAFAAASDRASPTPAVTAAAYVALALATNLSLRGEKRRLEAAAAELGRLKHGIDQIEDGEAAPDVRLNTAALTLRQISEEGRRVRHLDRASEVDAALARIVALAQRALNAHAVAFLQVDRGRDVAYVRASAGPASLLADAAVPLRADPVAFVVDRGQAFYGTDFPRLLHALPWYRGEVKIGSMLAAPVRTADVVVGLLVADRLEVQAFAGPEPDLLASFAEMLADEMLRARAAAGREDIGVEFKAVYAVSRNLSALTDRAPVRRQLLRSARDMVPVESAAVVMVDEAQTRYVVEEAHGWAKDYEGREVALDERTWSAWVLRSAEDPYMLDNVAGHEDRMPVLVLDEGSNRAESLLAVPLTARGRTLGALVLTGRRGAFDASAHRVLGILCNQAAAALSTIQLLDRVKEQAIRDGLTGLHNRRAFSEALEQALAREDRQAGRLGLLLLDIDHFKKLNDSLGHPAGDQAIKGVADMLRRHLRKGDMAARYGGEEFAVILPGADEAGALQLAERIRRAIASWEGRWGSARIEVTASVGAAVWTGRGQDAAGLLSAADTALYAAKQGGRNRVVAASSLP